MKTLIQNLGLTNTAFNEFRIISNKNIGFLLKVYHGSSKQDDIFELRSLFATFESLEICRISDACSSSKFEFKALSSKCLVVSNYIVVTVSYSYIVVTIKLYIVNNGEFKE